MEKWRPSSKSFGVVVGYIISHCCFLVLGRIFIRQQFIYWSIESVKWLKLSCEKTCNWNSWPNMFWQYSVLSTFELVIWEKLHCRKKLSLVQMEKENPIESNSGFKLKGFDMLSSFKNRDSNLIIYILFSYVARTLQNYCRTPVRSLKMHYFWRIRQAPYNIFEEFEQPSFSVVLTYIYSFYWKNDVSD